MNIHARIRSLHIPPGIFTWRGLSFGWFLVGKLCPVAGPLCSDGNPTLREAKGKDCKQVMKLCLEAAATQ